MIKTTLTTIALAALIAAGCGSDEPATKAASTKQQPTGQEKAVKFAECIRSNGVADFPDPDPKGEFDYGVSVSPAVWKAAVDACKDLQPPGSLSSERNPEQQAASLQFAKCIRENGVEDFPDPVNGEPLVDTTKIPSSNLPGGMDILNAAMQTCGDLVAAAAGGQR